MVGFEISSFILLLFLTSICAIIGLKLATESYKKLCIMLFILGYAMYSGIGICLDSVSDGYFVQYFLFLLCFILSFVFSSRIASLKKVPNSKFALQDSILQLSSCLFWIIIVISFFYPVNHFASMSRFKMSLNDVFLEKKETGLEYILRILKLSLRPLYYSYLLKKNKPALSIFLLVLEVLIGGFVGGYVSRTEMLSSFLLIMFVLVIHRYSAESNVVSLTDRGVLFRKFVRVLSVFFLIVAFSLPALYLYQLYRVGLSNGSGSTHDMVWGVLSIEFAFPTHFDECVMYHKSGMFLKYLLYLITLPIPSKSLLNISTSFTLNYSFTTFVTGINYGDPGYSVVLSGLLGEGLIICGPYFAFVFAILLGLLCGFFFKYYYKFKEMRFWLMSIIISIFLMNRGGSQGTVSTLINASVLFFLLSIFDGVRIVSFKQKRMI